MSSSNATPSITAGHGPDPLTTTTGSPTPSNGVPFTNATSNTDAAPALIQPQAQINDTEEARFPGFRNLATELRLKIWGLAASEPRVIELDNVFSDSDIPPLAPDGRIIGLVRVAPNSRVPPAVLYVNRESRTESLRYYRLTNFEKKPRKWGFQSEHSIYYNPQVDIVYFGEQSDYATLVKVLRKGLEIPTLAIIHSRTWIASIPRVIDLPLLTILHGIDTALVRANWLLQDPYYSGDPWPGCRGLRTLLLVIPTGVRHEGGNSAVVHFQTATEEALAIHEQTETETGPSMTFANWNDGLAIPTRRRKKILPTVSDVKDLNTGREMTTLGGANRWQGDANPTFFFANIGEGPLLTQATHKIIFEVKSITKKVLEDDNYALTRKIATQTGCTIDIDPEPESVPPERDEQGRLVVAEAAFTQTREVRFSGSWQQIRIAFLKFKTEFQAAEAVLKRAETPTHIC